MADDGVCKYDKEFGSGNGSIAWLNPATRKAIAAEPRDFYEDSLDLYNKLDRKDKAMV